MYVKQQNKFMNPKLNTQFIVNAVIYYSVYCVHYFITYNMMKN